MLNLKARKYIGDECGDCFQVSADYIVEHPEQSDLLLVHALVRGQGPIEGVTYSHGWIEKGDTVISVLQGSYTEIPKELYYVVGQVKMETVVKYNRKQAMDMLLKHELYGPWDEKVNVPASYED